MEQEELLIRDKCVAGLKIAQLILNSAWVAAMLTHFYSANQFAPFSS